MEKRAKRGLTLGELLVVVGLLGLMLSLALGFLISVFRSSGQASVRHAVQTKGLLLSEELLKAFRSTGAAGLTAYTDPDLAGVSIVPLETVTTTGQQVWKDDCFMYYWIKSERRLYKRTCPPLPAGVTLEFAPDIPPQPTDGQFLALFTSDGRRVADGVTLFSVTKSEGVASFDLRLEEEVSQGRKELFSLRREVGFKS